MHASGCPQARPITGVLKKRACEIIAGLEPEPCGIYAVAVGFFARDGQSVFNIAIWTMIVCDGHATCGIGSDSDHASEYDETRPKAAGLFASLS